VQSPTAYVILAGLYLLGAIGGLMLGCHVGEYVGKKLEKPIPGLLVGAGIGGTLGVLVMYGVTRWVLSALL
jgi:hypothetical protein